MKEKYYIVDILNTEYWVPVYVGSDYKKLHRYLDKHFQEKDIFKNESLEIRGKTFYKKDYLPFIFVNTKYVKSMPFLYAALAHEGIHACADIFDNIGEGTDEIKECFPHSVGAIVRSYTNK